MIEIRPATEGYAAYIGRNLREADEREVWAATGRLPSRVVVESFRISSRVFTAHRGGRELPYAIFGVADSHEDSRLGVVWMLCTTEVSRVPLETLKSGPEWLDRLSKDYPRGLHSLAHKENLLHVRWCHLSGFEELGEVQHRGHPFIHIHRPNQHV